MQVLGPPATQATAIGENQRNHFKVWNAELPCNSFKKSFVVIYFVEKRLHNLTKFRYENLASWGDAGVMDLW